MEDGVGSHSLNWKYSSCSENQGALRKESVFGTAVNKEGLADCVLGHESDNCKQCFLLLTY